VYALKKQAALTYSIQPESEAAITQQKQSFTALLQELKQASSSEIESILDEREKIEAEEGLNSEAIAYLQQRIIHNS
ncbi:MAG: hypothetical protein ACKO2V_03280, partial [Snowella sp.]